MTSIHLKRMFRAGFLNFTRNGIVSLAAVIVMTITLSVLSGILLFQHVLETTLVNIENQVDVTVYVVPGADETAILSLQKTISALPEVADVKYVSEHDALLDFTARHQGDQTTLDAISELDSNPIGAMLNIRAKDISEYPSIAKFLDDQSSIGIGASAIIDHVDYNKNKSEIDTISSILTKGRMLGLIVVLVLMLLSVIVTWNTIRLAIYFSKEEISVMRLVGASRMHVQGPYIVEGILYGLSATILTMLIFIPITLWLGNHMTDFFGGINLFKYYVANVIEFFLILGVFGIGLGALSSVLAARKHLKI